MMELSKFTERAKQKRCVFNMFQICRVIEMVTALPIAGFLLKSRNGNRLGKPCLRQGYGRQGSFCAVRAAAGLQSDLNLDKAFGSFCLKRTWE